MPQIRADGVRPAVDQLSGELGVMEGLVPELPLRPRGEDPLSDPGQRRRDDQGADQIRSVPGDGLGNPAADVIAGDDRPPQLQLADQPDDAAGLGGSVVLAGRIRLVLVGFTETPQVRHDHVGGRRHERDDLSVVGPVPRPAMQQQHRGPRPDSPGSLIGQPESVDRRLLAHTGHYLPARAGRRLRPVADRGPAGPAASGLLEELPLDVVRVAEGDTQRGQEAGSSGIALARTTLA